MPDRAAIWEMFEEGASIHALQGTPRDAKDAVAGTRMLVVRYIVYLCVGIGYDYCKTVQSHVLVEA